MENSHLLVQKKTTFFNSFFKLGYTPSYFMVVMRTFWLLILLFVMRKTAFHIAASYLISFIHVSHAFLTFTLKFCLDFPATAFIFFSWRRKKCAIFYVHICNALEKFDSFVLLLLFSTISFRSMLRCDASTFY